jgi:RHS repeat-associated protein
MDTCAIRASLALLIVMTIPSAGAATLEVRAGAGCSDATGAPYCTINAAIAAAAAGDTIQIAAGTYATNIASFSKPLHFAGAGPSPSGTVITKSMTYTGAGPLSLTSLRIQGGGSNLKINGTGPFSGLTVSDAAFVGNGGGAHGIFIRQNGPVSNVTATHCTFTNHGQSGFLIQTGSGASTAVDGVSISGSTFEGNGEYGLRIDAPTTNLTVTSSSIANNAIDGIVLLNTAGAVLQDLTITGNRNGILLIPLNAAQSISDIRLTNVNASSNTRFISGQYGSGMTLSGAFGSITNVTATGSTFSSNTVHGVAASGQVSGASIECSIVAGNGQQGISNGSSPSATVSAEHVYWGCAGGPGAAGCSTVTGDIDFTPFRASAQDACTGDEELPPDPSTVAPPIDPTKISNLFDTTAFLYTGTNPIQRGVTAGAIGRLHAAVLRGQVFTRNGGPLPGVRVTVTGHPEYGHTLTRADGRYDLAVNGGGEVTIHLEKNGYIPVDRTEDVPWNRYVIPEDVAMVAYDPSVSVVTLGSPQAQVARGSAVTDEDGTRQATLIFQPNTTATMTLSSGGTQPLSIASVRATELSVGPDGPKAMPALLPPLSGYTYCVELSADEGVAAGAARIDFDKPVAFYVENFLGFPDGGEVPTGYYDRNCNKWVAAPNGRVVLIVGIVENRAYLDIDGDGLADDSDALLGTTVAEREQLATLYVVGTSLWRVPIPHFTPWDHNWPFGPPMDAVGPPGDTPPVCEQPGMCSVQEAGSIIECEAQNLGEAIPITGTPFTLSYNSSRVPGRTTSRRLHVKVTGGHLPDSLRRVELTIDIAGRREKRLISRVPHQTFDHVWDQKDPYGREWQGVVPVSVTVGYVYNGVYQDSAANEKAFARIGRGNAAIEGDLDSRTITLARNWTHHGPDIGSWDARGTGFGGWTLDGHHVYDSSSNTLESGDGSRRKAQAGSLTIRTLGSGTGSGARGVAIESFAGIAGDAMPENPQCMTAAADGTLYVGADQRVFRIAPDGTSTVVAGDGSGTFNGDGIAATSAGIDPAGLALGPDGALYIADETNRRVRRVLGGVITTVAGNGEAGYAGNGDVPATGSPLTPVGVAVAPDGTLYAADRIHNVVRSVDLCANEMWSIAGSGPDGGGDDGGDDLRGAIIRTNAGEDISGPSRVVAAGGSLYIVAAGNAIYRLTPGGQIEQITGFDNICVNYSCFPAEPGSILVHGETLYYTSPSRHTVNAIYGSVHRVIAGTGTAGLDGDGGYARAARLNRPRDLFLRGDGALGVVDSGNGRIRIIEQPYPGLANGETAIATQNASAFHVFDEYGRHLRTVDALFGTTKLAFGYDGNGLLTSVTDVDGNITRIERSGPQATAIVAPGGQRTELAYNAAGYLRSATNPAGEAHQFAYGFLGLMTSMTDPRAHTYTFEYDTEGRLRVDRDPAGGSKTLARTGNAEDYSVSVVTAEGRTATHTVETGEDGTETRWHTDQASRMTTVVRRPSGQVNEYRPDGTSARMDVTPDGRFGIQAALPSISIQHPGGYESATTLSRSVVLSQNPSQPVQSAFFVATLNGRSFTRFFDGATRSFTTTSPAGRTVTHRYDVRGHVIEIAVDGLAPVSMTYDSRGLLTAVAQGGRSMTVTYDARRRPATITDPLDDTITFQYDDADRVTSQTLPGGRSVSLAPDANGNITSLTPPGRPPHLFTFDAVDMPVSHAFPGGSTETAGYDSDHRVNIVHRGDGRDVPLTYGDEDRISSMSVERGDYAFTWNADNGQLESVTAPDGSVLTFSFTGSLLESASWTGSDVSGTIFWSYDSDRRMISETVMCPSAPAPSCDTVDYDYDPDDLLIRAGDLVLENHPSHGALSGTTIGAIRDAYTYNEYGEVTRFEALFEEEPFFSQELTRDPGGRITRSVETIDGTATAYDYGYDPARRLASVQKDGAPVAAHTYDDNNNRLTRVTPAGTATGAYDSEDRVGTYGGATYAHTAAGDLQSVSDSSGTTSYVYDELRNLTRVELPGGSVIEYVIDGLDRRIAKKVDGVVVRRWLYRNSLQIAAELDSGGNVSARFVYASRTNVPDLMITPNGTYRLIPDHLGSVRLVMDVATADVAQQLDYDELGNVTGDSNPGFQPFGFAGGLYDPDTKLVRFGARDYDPRTGRWTSRDPIGFTGGDTNLYGYTFADPVNFIDPSGLDPLTRCQKLRLKKYFPVISLDEVAVHPDSTTTPKGFDAITLNHDIHFAPGAYDTIDTADSLELLAHELTHVQQFETEGAGIFLIKYGLQSLHSKGYPKGARFEQEANDNAKNIRKLIEKEGLIQDGSGCGCQLFQ